MRSGLLVKLNVLGSDSSTLTVASEFPDIDFVHISGFKSNGENFGNLLNDDWGVLREAGFPRYQQAVDAGISDDGTRYEFTRFLDPAGQGRDTDASTWEMRFGFRYDF